MPEIVEVRGIRCFSQAINYDPQEDDHWSHNTADFNETFVGNVLEQVKLRVDVYVSVVAFTESPLVETRNSAGEVTGTTPAVKDWRHTGQSGFSTFVRASGSFIEDGFREGNFFYVCKNWLNRFDYASWVGGASPSVGKIHHISNDGKTIQYSGTLSGFTYGEYGNIGLAKKPDTTTEPAYEYAFGLTAKGANPDYLSKVTGEAQRFFKRNGTSTDALKPKGEFKSWASYKSCEDCLTGVTVQEPNNPPGLSELLLFPLKYVVRHTFYITPFFNEEVRLILNAWSPNTPIRQPQIFLDDGTLDYSFELIIRDTITDRTKEVVVRHTIPGSIGWFNESFNDLGNPFKECALEGVISLTATPFIINITLSDDFDGEKNLRLYNAWATLFRIPNTPDEYIGTKTSLSENFIIKRIASTGSGIISDWYFEGFVFTSEEKAKIKRGDKYLLAFSMEMKSGKDRNKNSRRAQVIADIGEFSFDPPLEGYVETASQIVDGYASNYQCSLPGSPYIDDYLDVFDEDIVNVWAQINFKRFVNRVSGAGKAEMDVEQMAFGLIAESEDTGERFEIDRFEMPLPTDSGGTSHDYHIEGKRTYTTEVDQSSDASFTCGVAGISKDVRFEKTNDWMLSYNECPASWVSPEPSHKCQYKDNGDVIREYHLNCAQAVRWQDWWRNAKVPETFFDPSKPADGLNRKSSRFSDKQNFDVFLGVFFRMRGETKDGEEVEGEEFEKLRRLKVWSYDEKPPGTPPDFEGNLELFIVRRDADDNEVQMKSEAVVVGEQMLIRSTYKYFGDNNYVIHRIEESKNATDIIWESGTGYFNKAENNPLFTKQDEIPSNTRWAKNTVQLEDNGNTLISECYLDGTRIKRGQKYKISSRLGYSPHVSLPIIENWGLLTDDGILLTGDGGQVLQQDAPTPVRAKRKRKKKRL